MAVLPLLRWRRGLGLDATCLVVGSMAPDFEYFVRVHLDGRYGHTLAGLFVFCLPITLVCAALFQRLAKWPLLLVAPEVIARRIVPFARAAWPELRGGRVATIASLVVSALLGAVTHVVWDSFTHGNGWGVAHIHFLRAGHHWPWRGWRPMYTVAQHASTVVGLTVLSIVVIRILRRAPAVALPRQPRSIARVVYLGCLAGAFILAVVRIRWLHTVDLGNLVVASISAMLAGTIIAGLCLRRIAMVFRAGCTTEPLRP